jgi:hypothetical protein
LDEGVLAVLVFIDLEDGRSLARLFDLAGRDEPAAPEFRAKWAVTETLCPAVSGATHSSRMVRPCLRTDPENAFWEAERT